MQTNIKGVNMHRGIAITKVIRGIEYDRAHEINAKRRKMTRDEFKRRMLSRYLRNLKISYKTNLKR